MLVKPHSLAAPEISPRQRNDYGSPMRFAMLIHVLRSVVQRAFGDHRCQTIS